MNRRRGEEKKKNWGLLRQNLQRMEDSSFLHLLSCSSLPLPASPSSSHVAAHPHACSARNLFVPLKEASISSDKG